jgi:alkylation response protein AidB-like acyl-CoA dehydrogenase
MGASAPQEPYGGAGLDTISLTLLIEALAAECPSTAVTIHVHNSQALCMILRHAGADLAAELLPEMIAGRCLGALALNEASAGGDPTRIRAWAVRDGASYLLNGVKTWVSNGSLAGVYMVFAMTDPAAEARGISAFAVPASSPGLRIGAREKTLGLRGASFTRLYLDDCRVPAANLLGGEGDGYGIALEALDSGRLGLAAIALGIGRRALATGARDASEQLQFAGPNALLQSVQAYVADAATAMDAAESLVRRTAWLADIGQPFAPQAAMAKLFASHTAAEVTDQMLQVYSGNGFGANHAIERSYRDARVLELLDGTSQVQQAVIANAVLGEYGFKPRP